MATCALVGTVDFNADHFREQQFDCVIAVDGGYKHLLDIGYEPDAALGDFDSLGYVPEHINVIEYPAHKDESDIELALEYATDGGYHRLVVYGCLGGRFDHSYGVMQLIARFTKADYQVFVVGADTIVTGLEGGSEFLSHIEFSDRAEGTVSLFAFDEQVFAVNETGLEYSLEDATLRNTEPLGVSNAFSNREARIAIGEGTALVFFPVDAWVALAGCK